MSALSHLRIPNPHRARACAESLCPRIESSFSADKWAIEVKVKVYRSVHQSVNGNLMRAEEAGEGEEEEEEGKAGVEVQVEGEQGMTEAEAGAEAEETKEKEREVGAVTMIAEEKWGGEVERTKDQTVTVTVTVTVQSAPIRWPSPSFPSELLPWRSKSGSDLHPKNAPGFAMSSTTPNQSG